MVHIYMAVLSDMPQLFCYQALSQREVEQIHRGERFSVRILTKKIKIITVNSRAPDVLLLR